MQPELLRAPEDLHHELALHHRLAAGQRDAAAADLEYLGVLADLAHRTGDGDRPSIVFVPGVGVVAILAAGESSR
jgi:hypothetical protein